MFTFLNSIILSALLAALIPLLIHLFNKQKTKNIKFSSLRFLKKLEKQRLKKVKIFQILLILIRTLLIILLVIAFARPTFSGTWSILQEPSANTTAVIILDDGLNMRQYDTAGNRFKRAKTKMIEVLKSFNSGDKTQILKTSNSEFNFTDSVDIQLQECSYLIGNMRTVLVKAKTFFADNINVNKELHIVSDMNINLEPIRDFARNNQDIKIYIENVMKPGKGNISIEKVEFENSLFEINKPLQVSIHLKNHTQTEAMMVNTHLFINDKRMAQNNSTVNSGEQKSIALTYIPKSTGWNIGYVEIDDDDLIADNKYYFALRIPEKAKVLFVDNLNTPYLYSAIEAMNLNTNIEILTENYNTLARQRFNQFDVLFFANIPDLPQAILLRLKSYLASRGGLILIPGEKTVPANFNSTFGNFLGGLKITNLKKRGNNNTYFTLNEIKKNNPVLSGIFQKENPEISLPKFKKYFKMTEASQFQTLMRFNDGSPFLLYSNNKNLKAFILSSYLDDSWTDIQYKGIFLPLLMNMIKFSAFQMNVNKNQVLVGNELAVTLNRNATDIVYELISPGGEKNRIIPIFTGGEFTFEIKDLNIPGNYKLQKEEDILTVVSANVDAAKIDPNNFEREDLIADNENIELINEDDSVNEIVKEARFGEEIWKYIIALVVLVIMLESFLVKRIEGKI